MTRSLALLTMLAACGSDPAPGGADAAPAADAAPVAAAEEINCPATVAADVGVAAGQYDPSAVTVAPGEVVRFTTSVEHSARAVDATLFDIPFGVTACVRFNQVGTYGFYCTAHGFTGTVTVAE
ncbi:MAG: hypothetical protein R2939_22870 [Kofleriaceae bacterium]